MNLSDIGKKKTPDPQEELQAEQVFRPSLRRPFPGGWIDFTRASSKRPPAVHLDPTQRSR